MSGFSLSKDITEKDQMKPELVRTPSYLSPVILLAKQYSKKATYMHSLIVYDILTNEKPFFFFTTTVF